MSDILLRYGEESERGSLNSSKLAISEGQLSVAYKSTPDLSDYVTLPSKDARIYFDLTNTERIPVNAYFADHAQDAKEAITLRGLSSTVGELNSLAGITENVQEQLNNRLPLSGGTLTGDIILYAESGNSPSIIFQRGTLTDNYNDWRILNSSGILYFGQRGIDNTSFDGRIYFDNSGAVHATAFVGSLSGNATSATTAGQASHIPVYTSDPTSLTAGQIWINTSV